MPAPTDVNSQIAVAKGWTVERRRTLDLRGQPLVWKGEEIYEEYWYNPAGQYQAARPPNFTGTLDGVAGMMRELNERELLRDEGCNFVWGFDQYKKVYYVQRHSAWGGWGAAFESPPDRPGDCVGDAYMSVFRKEAADASEA